MKRLIGIALASFFLLLVEGCAWLDRIGPGVSTEAVNPTTSTVASSANGTAQKTDAAANGGSNLPASNPYSQPSGATTQQNINPAPFLTAAGTAAGGQNQNGTETAHALSTKALTTRADGTMSGPNDQPAATTGWGTQGTNWAGSAAPATKPPVKTPPKK